VIADLGSGGSQRVVLNLLSHWGNKGKSFLLVTFSDEASDFYKYNGRSIRIVSKYHKKKFGAPLIFNLSKVLRLRNIIKKFKPRTTISFITETNVIFLLSSVLLATKKIISERNDPYKQHINLYWQFLRDITYSWADVVTVNSYNALAFYQAKSYKNLKYVPNPITIFSHPPVHAREKIILSIGRLHHQKGYDLLLPLLSDFFNKNHDWKYLVIGSGEERTSLGQIINLHGLNDNVHIIDPTPNIADYYMKASCFILPSRYEGNSNALMEAMYLKLPCLISSDVGLGHPFLSHKINCLFFDLKKENSLAEMLDHVVSNSEILQNITLNAHNEIVKNFSLAYEVWDKIAD